MTRKELLDKQRASVKSGFAFCELCGCTKTPTGTKACVRCKADIKESAGKAASK